MHAALLELLTQTITFQVRIETSKDSRGNPVGDWEDDLVDVPCRFEFPSGREDRRGREVVHKISRCFVDGGTQVTEAHRATFSGRPFEITGVLIRYDEFGEEHHRTVLLEEVK